MSKENSCLNCVYKQFNKVMEIEYCTINTRVLSSCSGNQDVRPCERHVSNDAALEYYDKSDIPV